VGDLTPKQQAFVTEYLIDLNATQAAIRAGYSAKDADVQGPRLLGNVRIAAAVALGMEQRTERTQINADWVLTRLAIEAEADMAELYDESGKLKSIHDWPLIWRQGLVAGVETVRERSSNSDEEVSFVDKIKVSDRIKRLELIGRHVGVQAFKDKVEVDVTDDLAAVLNAARNRAINAKRA
jgi:phage terminase small subunit